MRLFDISDVLSVTTGRLVSSRHMDGVYDILNFMTGDNLFTHWLPRAAKECEPCLRAQFPDLMRDSPRMVTLLAELDRGLTAIPGDAPDRKDGISSAVATWVEWVRKSLNLPEQLPVYELGADIHTRISSDVRYPCGCPGYELDE